jgi:Ca2+-binding EF-hand superfamily protein
MKTFDKNNDGKLNFNEFFELCEKIYPYCLHASVKNKLYEKF